MRNIIIILIALALIAIFYNVVIKDKKKILPKNQPIQKGNILGFIEEIIPDNETLLEKFTGKEQQPSSKSEPIQAGNPPIVPANDITKQIETVSAVPQSSIADIVGYPAGSTQTSVS